MDEMERYLVGTVHMDKAFAEARKNYATSATGQSFDEHLHAATIALAANAVRAYLESDEVVERVGAALQCAWDGHEGLPPIRFYEPERNHLARAALQAAGGKGDAS